MCWFHGRSTCYNRPPLLLTVLQLCMLLLCVFVCWQVMKYLFSGQPELRAACNQLLRLQPDKVSPEQLLDSMVQQVRGPRDTVHRCTR
jgi:hypothetical protein